MNTAVSPDSYGASAIKLLKGLEPVRKRPGMYIGGTDEKAYHHCLWEIIDNSVDEALAGFCKNIQVELFDDGSACVKDDGRGIPVDIHPEEGVSAATLVFTELHGGGKFDNDSYKTSGGLHGVGASVTNALSEFLDVRIKRQGGLYGQDFRNGGEPVQPVERLEELKNPEERGTQVHFKLDLTHFEKEVAGFDRQTILQRIKTVAYLTPGLTLTLIDYRTPRQAAATDQAESEDADKTEAEMSAEDMSSVAIAEAAPEPLVDSYCFESFTQILDELGVHSGDAQSVTMNAERTEEIDGEGEVEVRVALRWHKRKGKIAAYANNIPTSEGVHLTGLTTAVTRFMNQYAADNNLYDKKSQRFSTSDVTETLVAAVSANIPDPKFSGQTKDKLTNQGVQGAVSRAITAELKKVFEENPKDAKAVIADIKLSNKAREAAEKAHDLVVDRKSIIASTSLPGKLADCQEKDPKQSEVFIVEGDSAGGSAKQGRDRHYQAILPLKGKILNTYRADAVRTISSDEVKNIIQALGCGYKTDFNIEKLRYHKIIILSDADVDGAHITTLALTFFHTYYPQMITEGHVFVALPPLYRVTRKGQEAHYLKDEAELEDFLEAQGDQAEKWQAQRFKGLGEMNPEQLWEAAMDPRTRQLAQVYYSEGGPEEDDSVFELLMGPEVEPRRAFIESNASYASLDI